MKGSDEEQTARSGKSDPIATKEKKGALPPEKPAINID
jgi:hypothetical protein